MSQEFTIVPERESDEPAIEALHETTFGPGRFARTAYRIRESAPREPTIAFVALMQGGLVGSVRLTAVRIGGAPALLLGPLAVRPDLAGRGAGALLMQACLEAAKVAGHRLVVLIGDEPYYARFGFARVPRGRILFPGPVDPDRVLIAALAPGAFDGVSGPIEAIRPGEEEGSPTPRRERAEKVG